MDTDSLVSHLTDADQDSRRSFLKKSAAAGAGTLALAVGASNTALAHDATDDGATDIEVLNFALTLEHLEYAFYRDSLERFKRRDFMRAKTLAGFGGRVRSDVQPNLADIRDHEETHVSALQSTITNLGGTPVEEAEYQFGLDDVDDFLRVAAVLENTGVSAYDGSINLIEDADLIQTGATIATVEARHASYLNVLNGDDPFPEPFDTALSMDDVLAAAGGFIVD